MSRPRTRLTALALCASLMAASAASQPPGAPPPPAPSTEPQGACDRAAPDGLAFSDDEAFEGRLRGALAGRPPVLTVGVARPFSPETVPDRAHAWLVETARQGGAVQRRDIPCGAQRGASRPMDFGMRAFLARPGDSVAQAVRGYDAVLWVEQATGAVNQIQFIRRGA